jgi:8-oxo-dGTP diphosphatase
MSKDTLDENILRKHKGISFVGVTTCFVCHDNDGRIFMAKRSSRTRDEHGRWDVGGGGLDWGLTAESNTIKEIQEEYSATPIKIKFMGYRDVFRTLPDGTSTHWLALDFAAQVNPEDVIINEVEMFEDSGWFTIDDLPAPLHSQVPNMFKANENQLKEILNVRASSHKF